MNPLLIRLIAGLCVAILFMVLFIIDERDEKNRQEQTKTIKRNKRNSKPNTITIKSIY